MQLTVFLAVLVSAACHAGWNALIKGSGDRLATACFVAFGSGAISLPLLAFTGLPNSLSIIWAVASSFIHLFYFAFLIEAYEHGDLGQVYPLARGTAPLLTAIASSLFVEQIPAGAWVGLMILAGGVLVLALPAKLSASGFNKRGVVFAFATALAICVYSILDGLGARLSGNPNGYTLVLFVACAVTTPAYILFRRPNVLLSWKEYSWIGIAGGGLQTLSYGVVIWAMTLAPIAIVAALRETSVLFAALISVIVLKEEFRPSRMIAAVLILIGLAILKVS